MAEKWFWREIGSFFVVAGKFYYDRKKKFQSSVWRVVLLCQFLVLAICDHHYDHKKKIQLSVWWVRDHYYDRKKKDTVVCLVGAQSCLCFLSRSLYLY